MKEYDGSVSLSRRFNAAFRRQTRWRAMKKAMSVASMSHGFQTPIGIHFPISTLIHCQ
jgi:hypothetical protein